MIRALARPRALRRPLFFFLSVSVRTRDAPQPPASLQNEVLLKRYQVCACPQQCPTMHAHVVV